MKALISPNEQRETGFRVAETSANGFDVAEPLFWVECTEDVVADQFWYDPSEGSFKPIPEPEQEPILDLQVQPTVQGAETL